MTVAGTTSTNTSSVAINGSTAGVNLHADATFAKAGLSLSNGINTFTAVAQDALGRSDTNSVSVWMPTTRALGYDNNGNLVSDGLRGFEYDDENQLIRITVTNAWMTEFVYDGMLRCRVRREKTWVSGAWQTASETRYVYHGRLVMQERDGNNQPRVTYTRGPDLSGTLSGAGGIGGLLARTENPPLLAGRTNSHTFYHADAGGNITAMTDGTQGVVARYLYDPYGNTISRSGPLAEVNVYRFSSKELHSASGLYAYGFRFYDPNFQRWVNRDPLGERFDSNLYRFNHNSPGHYVDPDGRFGIAIADWIDNQVDNLTDGSTSTLVNFAGMTARGIGGSLRFGEGLGSGRRFGAFEDLERGCGLILMLAGPAGRCCPAARGTGLETRGIRPAPGTRVRPEGVPENWRIRNTDTPGGTEYYNPRNPNESVRVMQGNPNSPYPNSQSPYVRQRDSSGTYLQQDGTPSPLPRGGRNDPDAHIPLDQFQFRQ